MWCMLTCVHFASLFIMPHQDFHLCCIVLSHLCCINKFMLHQGGPIGVIGQTKEYKCKESDGKNFDRVKKWRLKVTIGFPHVNTEAWQPTENLKIKCEDCILKCKILKIKSGWLDPPIKICQQFHIFHHPYNEKLSWRAVACWSTNLQDLKLQGITTRNCVVFANHIIIVFDTGCSVTEHRHRG